MTILKLTKRQRALALKKSRNARRGSKELVLNGHYVKIARAVARVGRLKRKKPVLKPNATETVAQFLKRGGRIKKYRPQAKRFTRVEMAILERGNATVQEIRQIRKLPKYQRDAVRNARLYPSSSVSVHAEP